MVDSVGGVRWRENERGLEFQGNAEMRDERVGGMGREAGDGVAVGRMEGAVEVGIVGWCFVGTGGSSAGLGTNCWDVAEIEGSWLVVGMTVWTVVEIEGSEPIGETEGFEVEAGIVYFEPNSV
jgi:hypothetical protein